MLLLAGMFGVITGVVMRRQLHRARIRPFLQTRDGLAAALLLLRALTAGALFGFGLAMVLDSLLGVWGILLSVAICFGLGAALLRVPWPVEVA
jgi:hypothetical protein